jgi:hypothetical protein
MGSNSEENSNRHKPWQFTLRSLMIVVTILCVILSLGSWLGLRGYLWSVLAVLFGLLAFAVYRRRKVIAILCAVLLAGTVSYYYYGHWTVARDLCLICGKDRIIVLIGGLDGVECYSEERETDTSNWYRQLGVKPHNHRWRATWATENRWGGEVACYDNFLGGTLAQSLHDVSEKVDKATFEDLIRDCRARDMNADTISKLYDRCDKIRYGESK